MRRIVFVLVLISATSCTSSAPTGQRPERPAAEVDASLAAELQRALDRGRELVGSPGAQAAVVLPDGSVWTGASGLADVDREIPVSPETRFAMGSSMKLHTAALVLDLVEDGTLSLNDRLAQWIPEFRESSGITLRHLLLHTSGLALIAGSDIAAALDSDPDHHLTYDELLLDPVCAPGACYHYQSPDYELMAEVVERATGYLFVHEVRTRLWEPLDLSDTYFPDQERASGPMATGYGFGEPRAADEVATCDVPSVVQPYPCGGGGLLATAGDTARFAHALLSGHVLERSSLEQLLDFEVTQGLPGVGDCDAVGLGLVRRGSPERGEHWSHGGFTGDFHSSAPHYPRYGVTTAVVVNDGAATSTIEDALAEVVLDDAPVADAKAGKGFCNFDIYVVGRGGDDRRRLTNHPSLDGSTVSWAPDGERMAFGSTRSGNPEIFVMTADGTRQRNITRHPAGDIGASWSPDGKRILFHSDRDGSNDIWVMDSDGSNATQLTRGPADDVIPSWSPDGSRIAYAGGVSTTTTSS